MVTSVLIASHDAHVRKGLAEQLTQMGWSCVEAQSPDECKQIAAEAVVHAAVIDADSVECSLPPGLPMVRLGGVDTGNSWRLAKPAPLRSILSLLSQSLSAAGDEVTLKPGWRLLTAERTLVQGSGSIRVALTDKERDLLLFLARAGKAGTTREMLLGRVWGYSGDAATHTVETHIHRLRSKLRDAKIDEELIETLSEGYRIAL